MHNSAWQALCGFFTDLYESLDREDISMKHIFEDICMHDKETYQLWTENGKRRQITYGELMGLCAGTARKIDSLVPEKEGVIALHLSNCAMWPVIFWAILMTGHTPLLLTCTVPITAFEKVLRSVGCVSVIGREAGCITPESLTADPVRADIALYDNRWADRMIFMTSGTSGDPKLVVYNGKCMAKQIQSSRYFYRETCHLSYPRNQGAVRQLALLPFSHIFGFIICVIWYPYMGKQIVYPSSIRPDDVINTCQKMRVTHLCAVPSYFDIIIRVMLKAAKGLFGKNADGFIAYLKEGKFPSPEYYQRYQAYSKKLCAYTLGKDIRYIISGGGMLTDAAAAFLNRMGLYFCNGYGMTELGILSVEKSPIPEKRMQASVGHPSYGVKFTIDEDGELFADCDYAAVGYLTETGIVPLEKPFPTKDVARRLPDGRYMLIGRSDDVIIDNDGNRIHPSEIEERMHRIPGITGMCVIRIENRLFAFIEISPAADKAAVAEGMNRLNRNSPVSHFIHECYVVKALPRLAKGDVNRKAMAKMHEDGLSDAYRLELASGAEISEISMSVVFAVRRKTAELLGMDAEKILPDANFFSELGMDSLTYMLLVQWLETEYRMSFTGENGQRFESVVQLVDHIQTKERENK